MPIEQAIIARAGPKMLNSRLQSLFQGEISKGCNPFIAAKPVSLEPTFWSIEQPAQLRTDSPSFEYIPSKPSSNDGLLRFQIWISPEQEFSWLNAELFLKHLSSASYRIAFEIIGHRKDILIC